jgi:hypothetical protein
MKAIYPILFFAGAMILFALGYTFIKISTSGTSKIMPVLLLAAIVACINLLAYLIYSVM